MVSTIALIQLGLAILAATCGGGWALWQAMSNKIDKGIEPMKDRINKLEKSDENFMEKPDILRAFSEVNGRIDKVEQTRDRFVTRDEFSEGQRRVEKLIGDLTAATTQSTATLTARMDSLLFEIKRNDHDRR